MFSLIKTMYVFYAISHNMYYIVSNGEDMSMLYVTTCVIL